MSTRQRTYRWYIEPAGKDVAHSNEVISRNLPDELEGSFLRGADGKDHYLWSCSFKQAKRFWGSRESLQIDIQVWCQEGNGQIRRHTKLLTPRRTKAVRKVVNELRYRNHPVAPPVIP